jgi:hypothetical protein
MKVGDLVKVKIITGRHRLERLEGSIGIILAQAPFADDVFFISVSNVYEWFFEMNLELM